MELTSPYRRFSAGWALRKQDSGFCPIFSEFGLMRCRFEVEVRWLQQLPNTNKS